MSEQIRLVVASAALCVAVALIYGQVGQHEFVNFDDHIFILDNPLLCAPLGWESALDAFTSPIEAYWMPLTALSLQIDHALFGFEPGGYLLMNVAFHALASVLLLLAMVRLTGSFWPPLFVAAVFAVHPLHVESVAWASERKDVLSGVFFMATLWTYAWSVERPESRRRELAVLAMLSLGLLAKPSLVTLPFVLLLLDVWPLERIRLVDETGRLSVPWARLGEIVSEKIPLFAMAAGISVVTWIMQRESGSMLFAESVPMSTRILNAFESYGTYLATTVWPTDLALFYPLLGPPPLGRAIAGAALLVGATVWVVRQLDRRPWLAVGWFWFVGVLVPMIGLAQVGMQARADRFMYLPLIGLSITVAFGAAEFAKSASARRLCAGGAALMLAAAGATSYVQVGHWRDSETLFAHALEVTDDNYLMHYRIAEEFRAGGRLDEAQSHYLETLQITPYWARAQRSLADLLAARGDSATAAALFESADQTEWADASAHGRVGLALLPGYPAEAFPLLETAIALDPDSAILRDAFRSKSPAPPRG